MKNKVNILDHGYVRLVDNMGTDLSVVNAARASFSKESLEFDQKDQKLLNFLIREKHFSPFRHATLSFELYAPLFVCRQLWKYVVAASHIEDGTAHNESSRRYVTEEPIFYIPSNVEWRGIPENKKQGSGESVDSRIGSWATEKLITQVDTGLDLYNQAMSFGICAEQARLFLNAYGMYVRWRLTISLSAVIHLLQERLAHDAQYETQLYAKGISDLTAPLFPATFDSMNLGDSHV